MTSTLGDDLRIAGDASALRSMGLRTTRRALACLAILSCALLREFPPIVIFSLVAVCWLEQFLPSHHYFREPDFQRAVAWICYLTLPFFLFVFLSYQTSNPFHDALIGFLVFFQLKWAYAPRADFHWIGALFLFCLAVSRTEHILFGVLLTAFFALSIPYLAGMQELKSLPATVSDYLDTLRRRRRARMRSLMLAPVAGVVGLLIFYAWPRLPGSGLNLGSGGEAYTQLTDEVTLHKGGPLKKDFKIVARLRMLEGAFSPDDLYLRAGHLEAVSDSDWTFFRDNQSPPVSYTQIIDGPDDAKVPPASVIARPLIQGETPRERERRIAKAREAHPEIRYRLTVYDPNMKYFVRPGGAREVRMPARLKSLGNDFFEMENPSYPVTMDVRALVSTTASPVALQEVYPHLPVSDQRRLMMTDESRGKLLQWPDPGGQRVRVGPNRVIYRHGEEYKTFQELGNEWKGKARGDVEIALRFAEYLRSRYYYDLDPERPSLSEGENPLVPFLTDPVYNRGHCEIFAASLVALLRVQGIPSRLVNGFRGAEMDPETGDWVIRRMRAHTWAEFWSERYGWLSIDPTPAQVFRSYEGRIYYKVLRERLDALDQWWRKSVISYDYSVQSQWFRHLRDWTGQAGESLRAYMAGMLQPFDWLREKISGNPTLTRLFWAVMAFQAALIVALVMRWSGQWRSNAAAGDSGKKLARFWGRVERALGARGDSRRQSAETYRQAVARLLPRHAERIDANLQADLVSHIETRAYGGEAAPAKPSEIQARELELLERLETLVEKARHSSWNTTSGAQLASMQQAGKKDM